MTMTTSTTETATKLNPVQMHLLELFSRAMTERELLEIKELLAQYYARKADEVLDKIWENRGYTKASFKKETQNLHLRSKKRPAKP
jgi:hypothetical protein